MERGNPDDAASRPAIGRVLVITRTRRRARTVTADRGYRGARVDAQPLSDWPNRAQPPWPSVVTICRLQGDPRISA